MKSHLLVSSLVLLFGCEAFANNYFIPNYYRNRRTQNTFSALGWSDRKEVALSYEMTDTDAKTDGKKSSETDGKEIEAHGFYRLTESWNLEAVIDSSKDERQAFPITGPKSKSDSMDYNVGAGYQVSGMPLAFGAGIEVVNDEDTTSAGVKSSNDQNSVSLGAGYRLDSDIYLGVGYVRHVYKQTGKPSDLDQGYYLGAGKVIGDRQKPDGAGELIFVFANENNRQNYNLIAQGLINAHQLQYTGNLYFGRGDGPSSSTTYGAAFGADYQIMDFYVGPQLNWLHMEFDWGSFKQKSTTLAPSLEVGYRIASLEAFLRYTIEDGQAKFTGLSSSKVEYDGNTLTAQFTYKF